ncbi:hypothetical protein GH714_015591 [Hevea brasiliensis]|uniref:Homeobox domain-containing protein n=1 Tax=Hevea brasiliensis TaxID=3981 RepID=A0A6A6LXM0_HEVBR|nr:hypothetical protein GH714_015591 [Hevea brasiliensis]
MQAVVASFECVAGLGNAAPYANVALKTMSRHFRSLKNAITDQLQFIKGHGQLSHGKEEATRFGNIDRGPYCQSYPTDTDKLMLAKQTGLSRSQVSNWFINARVRLWKPMVEEIYMLETRQAQKSSQRVEQNANKSSDQVHLSNSVASDDPSASIQRVQDILSKRTRNDLPDLPPGNEEALNLSYNTQRFGLGLETSSEGFVMGSFEAQNRHFGRDVIGGQLLHDFVG